MLGDEVVALLRLTAGRDLCLGGPCPLAPASLPPSPPPPSWLARGVVVVGELLPEALVDVVVEVIVSWALD